MSYLYENGFKVITMDQLFGKSWSSFFYPNTSTKSYSRWLYHISKLWGSEVNLFVNKSLL
jgi:hypothetical protein